jgi:hypothetical protein
VTAPGTVFASVAAMALLTVACAGTSLTSAPGASSFPGPPSPDIGDTAASGLAAGPSTTPSVASTAIATRPPIPTLDPTSGPTAEATSTPLPLPTGYDIHIEKGLSPSWTAEAAAAVVYADLLAYVSVGGQVLAQPRIISVDAVSGKNLPTDEFGCCEPANSIRWIVRARGTFFNSHAGPAPGSRYFGTDGWFLYDDSGDNLGSGYKGIRPDLTGVLAGDPTTNCTWVVDQSGVGWQVAWPSGWDSTFDAYGVVLRAGGQQAAVSGSQIGVTGRAVDQQPTCVAAKKSYAATAIVYYSFSPLN